MTKEIAAHAVAEPGQGIRWVQTAPRFLNPHRTDICNSKLTKYCFAFFQSLLACKVRQKVPVYFEAL